LVLVCGVGAGAVGLVAQQTATSASAPADIRIAFANPPESVPARELIRAAAAYCPGSELRSQSLVAFCTIPDYALKSPGPFAQVVEGSPLTMRVTWLDSAAFTTHDQIEHLLRAVVTSHAPTWYFHIMQDGDGVPALAGTLTAGDRTHGQFMLWCRHSSTPPQRGAVRWTYGDETGKWWWVDSLAEESELRCPEASPASPANPNEK
jgi:hypothetical protein